MRVSNLTRRIIAGLIDVLLMYQLTMSIMPWLIFIILYLVTGEPRYGTRAK